MIKIGQSENLYVKSFTEDNFPYIEVFFDSTKKTFKGKLELRRISKHPTDKTKKLLHLTQKVKVFYTSPVKTHGKDMPEENTFQDTRIERVSDTVFNKIYSCTEEIPASVTTEMIEDKILSNKRACLYTILSNSPINPLGPGKMKEFTREDILSQVLTYHDDEEPNRKGDLFLDKHNKPQYRITKLSLTGQPDIDIRSSKEDDYFIPEFLKSKSYGRK